MNNKTSSEQRIQNIFHFLHDSSDDAIFSLSQILFSDPSPIVRHEAAYILGEKNSSLSVQALIDAIQTDRNRIVVHESSLALANLGFFSLPDGKEVLTALTMTTDEDIVDTAEIALQRLHYKTDDSGKQSDTRSLHEIITDFSKPNREKRIQAAFQLMDDSSAQSVQELIRALKLEPSPIVKHEMIFALGESIHYDAVPVLMSLLQSENNFFVVHETLLALGTIGDKRAENQIKKFLNHRHIDIVETAEIALERLLS